MIAQLPTDPTEISNVLPFTLSDSPLTRLPELLAALPATEVWLPIGIAVLLGLLLGGVLWRPQSPQTGGKANFKNRTDRDSFDDKPEATHTISDEKSSISSIAARQNQRHAAADLSNGDSAPITGRRAAAERLQMSVDLTHATASAERHRSEAEASRARAKTLSTHLDEQSQRISALTAAVDKALAGKLSPRQRSVAAARASLIQLAESTRGGRQWLGAAGDQLDSLQRRLKAAEQRLWATNEETTGFRHHLDQTAKLSSGRRSGEARRRLHHRVTEVDEQMRVYHQHLAGCMERVDQLRKHITPDHEHLRAAAAAIEAAESGLIELGKIADAEAEGMAANNFEHAFDDCLSEAEDRLAAVRTSLAGLDARAIEDADEGLERCHWVATEAPSGLRSAVERFGDCENVDDMGIAMMLSRSWRKLSEVGNRLDNLRVVAESGRVGNYPGCAAPSLLVEQLDKTSSAFAAIREPEQAVSPPGKPAPDCKKEGASPSPAVLAELSKTREKLARRERELITLQQRCKKLEADRKHAPQVASPRTPVTTRATAPGFIRALRPGDFGRRLVGLSPDADQETGNLSDIDSAAGNFREAQATLSELKQAFAHSGTRQHNAAMSNRQGAAVALLSNGDNNERDEAGNDLSALRAAFEKSLIRQDPSTAKQPAPTLTTKSGKVAERHDLKRFEAASEDLLSAVAQKKKPRLLPPVETAVESAEQNPVPETDLAVEVAAVKIEGITAGDKIGAGVPETLIFRGHDPRRWQNSDLAQLPNDISYLRLRRLDTGDSVVAPITRRELLSGAAAYSGDGGWSGSGERYFGGAHLGLFDKSLPRDVEVRLGAGGWGFGHASQRGSGQACGWAGEAIAAGTAFEITAGTHPIAGSSGEACSPASPTIANEEQIIFCSNDPGLWNRTVYQGARSRALALSELTMNVGFVRVQRLDSGASILLQATRDELLGKHSDEIRPFGFHAGNRDYYGARHLGVFDERVPNEVETKFTYGGWGFGHGNGFGLAGRQCAAWAGRSIDADTVFQITVFRDRPAALDGETFLGAAPRPLAG